MAFVNINFYNDRFITRLLLLVSLLLVVITTVTTVAINIVSERWCGGGSFISFHFPDSPISPVSLAAAC